MSEPSPCYLYIFGDKGGPYKVGCTHYPEKRAKQIAAWSPGRELCNADTATILYLVEVPGGVTAALIAESLVVEALCSRAVRPYAKDRPYQPRQVRIEWSSADIRTIRRLIDTSVRLVWTPEVICCLISEAREAQEQNAAAKNATEARAAHLSSRRACLRRLYNRPRIIRSRSPHWNYLSEWKCRGWIYLERITCTSAVISITTSGLKEAAKP